MMMMDELKQKKYDIFFMDIAKRVSEMSYAKRLKVGSILVKDGNIISFGWNGMPAGWDNNCEDEVVVAVVDGAPQKEIKELRTKPEVLHAEQNLLMKISKSTNSSQGATMYVTCAPCIECAKLIYQSGISRLIYRDTYRSTDGIDFLNKSGVHVNKYEAEG
jgi:dCMP deaminase